MLLFILLIKTIICCCYHSFLLFIKYSACRKLICLFVCFFSVVADLEKSHHQRVSELQRLRSMYVNLPYIFLAFFLSPVFNKLLHHQLCDDYDPVNVCRVGFNFLEETF